jgi:hypothetical protein
MYVGVIRGDLPGPLFLGDLEPVSQTNFPTEPTGQAVYVGRPDPVALTNFLAGIDPYYNNPNFFIPPCTDAARVEGGGGVPAGVEGSAAVTFPLTLTSSNNVLSVKTSSGGSFVSCTIPAAVYANMPSLVSAVNTALVGTGIAAKATTDSTTGTVFILESTALGVGAYIAYNATATSTFNTPVNFAAGGASFTMPTAAAIIAGIFPVGGALNVSAANVLTYLGAAPAAASAVNLFAVHLVETLPAIQSFQVGVMSKFLEATYNPDPTVIPAMASGPAITVVQDDGVSAYVAPLPIITGAASNTPHTGDITITGSDLGNAEFNNSTKVRVTGVATPGGVAPYVHLEQRAIANTLSGGTQGSVSSTSIVIPASLLNTTPKVQTGENLIPPPTGVALGVAGSTVSVEFTSLANTNYGTAANVTTVVNGVVTLTNLARMNPAMVGGKITLSGCASTANNGTFFITSYISASSVTINNTYGVPSDGNNGHIVWSQPAPVVFLVT